MRVTDPINPQGLPLHQETGARSLLKKGRRYGVFAGSAFDDLG